MDLKPFITGRIALEDLVCKGFHTLINHIDTAVKISFTPKVMGPATTESPTAALNLGAPSAVA